jgi:Zn(II)-responsive transcriptional regulator
MESSSKKPGGLQFGLATEKLKDGIAKVSANLPSVASGPVQEGANLTIGKLAKMAQLSPDTVRHYEKEGLVNPAQKSESGYRLYTDDALRRLYFIKHAQQCGLSLSEIRELLEMKRRDDSCCQDVRTVALQKKLQLESKIKALQTMSNALSSLIETCNDQAKPLDECPILAALETNLDRGTVKL